MAVALKDLRRARRRLEPESLARNALDVGIDGRVLPDRARQLADPQPLDRPSDSFTIPLEGERPAGELEPERRRLRVDPVRPPHAHGFPVLLCPVRHDVECAVQAVEDQHPGLLDGQRQRRVEHVRRGEAVVEPAPVVAQFRGHEIDERRDIVPGLTLTPADLVGRRRAGLVADPRDDVGRDDAQRDPAVECRELDLEHSLELPLVRPDPGHGGPGVASDHGAILDAASGGSLRPLRRRHTLEAASLPTLSALTIE